MDVKDTIQEETLPWFRTGAGKAFGAAAATALVGIVTGMPLFWTVVGSFVVAACTMATLVAHEYLRRSCGSLSD